MITPMQNTERAIFRGEGKYNIPIIKPETNIRIDKVLWIPINYAKTQHEPGKCGLHFYKDDYQFERLWNYPDKWIPLLQKFAVVCAPGFSIYKEMPLAMQIYQHFRKHWLAAYWQAHDDVRSVAYLQNPHGNFFKVRVATDAEIDSFCDVHQSYRKMALMLKAGQNRTRFIQ